MSTPVDRKTVPPVSPAEAFDGCRVYAASHVGCVREENQDYMGYFRSADSQLLVVADGMGGHSGGYEASRVAVEALRQRFFAVQPGEDPRALLADAIRGANALVRQVLVQNPELAGMGSTLVMVLIRGQRAWVAHVGDSRAYLLRRREFFALTEDHSRVHRMVKAGMITPEEAEGHPEANIIERSVGHADTIEPEVRPQPIQLFRGDRLVLCSDGISGLLRDPELATFVAIPDLVESVRSAIDAALQRGGDDNATVGIVHVFEGPEPDPATCNVGLSALPPVRLPGVPASRPLPQDPPDTPSSSPSRPAWQQWLRSPRNIAIVVVAVLALGLAIAAAVFAVVSATDGEPGDASEEGDIWSNMGKQIFGGDTPEVKPVDEGQGTVVPAAKSAETKGQKAPAGTGRQGQGGGGGTGQEPEKPYDVAVPPASGDEQHSHTDVDPRQHGASDQSESVEKTSKMADKTKYDKQGIEAVPLSDFCQLDCEENCWADHCTKACNNRKKKDCKP